MHLFHKETVETLQTVSNGDVVVWGDYKLLDTTGFSENANKFTCPVSAIYEFTLHMRIRPFNGELVMDDGVDVQVLLELLGNTVRRNNISGSVIVRCEASNQVFVRSSSDNQEVAKSSVFTGKILYRI